MLRVISTNVTRPPGLATHVCIVTVPVLSQSTTLRNAGQKLALQIRFYVLPPGLLGLRLESLLAIVTSEGRLHYLVIC